MRHRTNLPRVRARIDTLAVPAATERPLAGRKGERTALRARYSGTDPWPASECGVSDSSALPLNSAPPARGALARSGPAARAWGSEDVTAVALHPRAIAPPVRPQGRLPMGGQAWPGGTVRATGTAAERPCCPPAYNTACGRPLAMDVDLDVDIPTLGAPACWPWATWHEAAAMHTPSYTAYMTTGHRRVWHIPGRHLRQSARRATAPGCSGASLPA